MTILNEIKAGRLVVVPPVSVKLTPCDCERGHNGIGLSGRVCDCGPDHTAGLIALIEGMERERDAAEQALRTVQNAAKTIASAHGTELEHLRQNARFDHALRAEVESIRQHGSEMTDALLAAEARALAAEAEVERLSRDYSEIRNKLDHVIKQEADIRQNYVTLRDASLAAEAERDALREALSEIVKADTHLVWSGGSVREPSHDELGACAQIAARALTEKNNG